MTASKGDRRRCVRECSSWCCREQLVQPLPLLLVLLLLRRVHPLSHLCTFAAVCPQSTAAEHRLHPSTIQLTAAAITTPSIVPQQLQQQQQLGLASTSISTSSSSIPIHSNSRARTHPPLDSHHRTTLHTFALHHHPLADTHALTYAHTQPALQPTIRITHARAITHHPHGAGTSLPHLSFALPSPQCRCHVCPSLADLRCIASLSPLSILLPPYFPSG